MTDKETHFADMALNYGMMLANTRIALRNLVAAAEEVAKNPMDIYGMAQEVFLPKLRAAVTAAKEVLK